MSNRNEALKCWIEEQLGIREYELTRASEDASFRQYFRITYNSESAIIMDAPPEKEDCRPYVDIEERLAVAGVNVPRILHKDLTLGFLLITDLGKTLYLDQLQDGNVDILYGDALVSLSRIQKHADSTGLPDYDKQLLWQEMSLFKDWLVEKHLEICLSGDEVKQLNDLFVLLLGNALQQPRVFVHRDYHSRNLMYCEQNNPGIVDFQDAVYGPITYDLVSLLKDCYIKWPRDRINQWASDYCRQYFPDIADEALYLRWFDLMGVQRHLKASGIFARLFHRDGKAEYLKDVPRTLSYIVDLEADYPELTDLVRLITGEILPRLGNKQS